MRNGRRVNASAAGQKFPNVYECRCSCSFDEKPGQVFDADPVIACMKPINNGNINATHTPATDEDLKFDCALRVCPLWEHVTNVTLARNRGTQCGTAHCARSINSNELLRSPKDKCNDGFAPCNTERLCLTG